MVIANISGIWGPSGTSSSASEGIWGCLSFSCLELEITEQRRLTAVEMRSTGS